MKNNSSKCVDKLFVIILTLVLAVPVSMVFSSNAIAETIDATPLADIDDGGVILENETEPPLPPEIVRPDNYLLPDIPDNITYEEVGLPVFEHVEEPYNITLVTMNSPTGPLYEGKRKPNPSNPKEQG